MIIPDTSLVYRQQEIGAQWRHNFDEARHWRMMSKLSYMVNRDSGSGYFDYARLLFSQQLRWTNPRWEIKANARFGSYDYGVQRIGTEPLERSYAMLDVRIERRIGKRWLLYTAAERSWNISNDPLDEYRDWMASGGAGFEF